jgi:hypothetical protein
MKVIGGTVLIVFFILELDLALYCFSTRFARFRDAAMGYFRVIFAIVILFQL